ncbi:MAG TPA: type I polyketide synthase, partial [Longimicrobiaceae bacterium]|nr:type I polyketide synthase [Longimicrobiaceae bacterium]
MSESLHDPAGRTGLEVAVVGMAGRFPGAPDPAGFWENLKHARETVAFFGEAELRAAGVDPRLLARPDYVRARGALDGVEWFDAPFFGFSRREAEATDPQHRIFLECAWEALESAGYAPGSCPGSVGVYAGSSPSGYSRRVGASEELRDSVGEYQALLGNDKDHLATRVAYKLDLRGPAVSVQTACSTSLVAVHLACRSLLGGECSVALAGGVSASVGERSGYLYEKGGIRSPDGHCRAFDACAAGMLGGSGVGVVVLKRLEDALADGDTVHAVIRGSAINNDGSLKVGYTAPSVDGQAAAIESALVVAEVDPATVGYVEAHGTGTVLGDPVEVAALTQAFRRSTDRTGFCALGSVKTNVGHLDAAAGVAGLIKTVLSLRERTLVPSLHFERPNPAIDFAGSPFYVNTATRPWESGGAPRRAGVSSFGIGGTNAHVVLEEAPPAEAPGASREHQLLVLSARSEAALGAARAELAAYLRERPGLRLADVAHTLQVGRAAFEHRLALVCRDLEEAVDALQGDPGGASAAVAGARRPVAFLFPGQGAQHAGMGAGLYRAELSFREEVDRCAELLRPHLGRDLREVLHPPEARAGAAAEEIRRTELAQPALFVVEYALAKLWMGWGVRPEALLGHSVGEYVAATLAGVFSLEDALGLVAARGRLMQRLPGGAMLAVPLGEAGVLPLLGGELSLAAVNAPEACTVSGPAEAVERLRERLEEAGVACRLLDTSHAFHSSMMDPVLDAFRDRVGRVKRSPPEVPFLSNLTGTWITPEQAVDPEYWTRHLRETVRFSDAVAELLRGRAPVLLEAGPGQSLSRLAARQGERGLEAAVASLPPAGGPGTEDRSLLEGLGRLWRAGVPVD